MGIKIDIHKDFGEFRLDVSLETDSKRIGILGASGCGKSMTLKSIAGITTPDSGIIQIDDKVLFDSSSKTNLRPQIRNIGYLFQNYALFPNMTVLKNIESGLKGTKEENHNKAMEMVEKFQLKGLENRLPTQLSGGQQQRVALARIMAYEPDAILLDEPFSALDVFLKEQLQRELLEMLESYDGLVIMVSHSRDEIYTFADTVLVMDAGRDVIFGAKENIFANPTYVAAAKLTGCKNISKAERRNAHEVYLSDWDVTLKLEQEIPEDIISIGIRAHDFIPVWEEDDTNAAALSSYTTAQFPFELHYYINSGKDIINWFIQREMIAQIEEKGEPKYLRFPEEALLLLK